MAIDNLSYNNKTYKEIAGNVALAEGAFTASFNSVNPNIDFGFTCNGELEKDHYVVALDGDFRDINLQAMRIVDVGEEPLPPEALKLLCLGRSHALPGAR